MDFEGHLARDYQNLNVTHVCGQYMHFHGVSIDHILVGVDLYHVYERIEYCKSEIKDPNL